MTVLDLQFIQILYLVKNRWGSSAKHIARSSDLTSIYEEKTLRTPVIKRNATVSFKGRFIAIQGKKYDIDVENWSLLSYRPLERYNLFYFDFLNSSVGVNEVVESEKWIKHAFSALNTVEMFWDPYPTSLRACNLVLWAAKTGGRFPGGRKLLVQHLKVIEQKLEIHLQGNHLFENYRAIIMLLAALCWEDKLLEYVEKFNYELKTQFLGDGGHIERSPMYHNLLLANLLDCINIFQSMDRDIPKLWPEIVSKGLIFSHRLAHPDGGISYFNDSNIEAVPDLGSITEYARALQVSFAPPKRKYSALLVDSGFCAVVNSNFYFIVNCGSISPRYQPGHSHAEEISFEVSYRGLRLFVNSGVSTYQDYHLRKIQRSSASHNCLVYDGKNSSDVWKEHRVGRKARVEVDDYEEKAGMTRIEVSHNGYSSLLDKVKVSREFIIADESISILNVVSSSRFYSKDFEIFFHLHPEIKAEAIKPRIVLRTQQDDLLELVYPENLQVRVSSSLYSLGFGRTVDKSVIVFSGKAAGRSNISQFVLRPI